MSEHLIGGDDSDPLYTGEAVAGGITRQTLRDAADVPAVVQALHDGKTEHLTPNQERMYYERKGWQDDLLADTHDWDRRVLEDLRANAPTVPPLMSTPQDGPNPLFEMWKQASEAKEQEPFKGILRNASDLVAVGGYELVPTEYETKESLSIPIPKRAGQMVLMPDRMTFSFNVDTRDIEGAVLMELAPLVGQRLTAEVLKEVSARVVRALNAALQRGVDTSIQVPPGPLSVIGLDWKKKQAAIVEEQRCQAELQQRVQAEMDQAKLVDKHKGVTETTEYQKRDGYLTEFFTYETVGTTPAHVASVVKTDDPELMKALGDAVEQGRVVMDGDTIVSIDGVPTDPKSTFEDRRPDPKDPKYKDRPNLFVKDMRFYENTKRAFSPIDPPEDDVQPDAVVGN